MRVKTFFGDRQFRGSHSAVNLCNKHLEDAIIELGHQLIPFKFDPNPIKSQIFIPWDHLKSKQSFESLSSDIAIFCDRGVALGPPSKQRVKKNILFLHGLAYNIDLIKSLEDIDIIITPSLYWAEVTQMMIGGQIIRSIYDSDIQYISASSRQNTVIYPLDPPIQIISAQIDDEKSKLMNRIGITNSNQIILAHSIQPNKASFSAHVGIIIALAIRYRKVNKHLKVVTSTIDREKIFSVIGKIYNEYEHDYAFSFTLKDAEECFVFTDKLSQKLLHQLFRASTFGISYNDVPESFGMYVLESIANHCPVFSNGAGNMRHSLPTNHGHYISEPFGIYDGSTTACMELALEIIYKLEDQKLPEELQDGYSFIKSKYNIRDFKKNVRNILNLAKSKDISTRSPSFSFLQSKFRSHQSHLQISPLVRSFSSKDRVVMADHQNFKLTDREFNAFMLVYDVQHEVLSSSQNACFDILIDMGLICKFES